VELENQDVCLSDLLLMRQSLGHFIRISKIKGYSKVDQLDRVEATNHFNPCFLEFFPFKICFNANKQQPVAEFF
jgi:hypothetical protein